MTKKLRPHSSIVVDEAIRAMYKRTYADKMQIFLNQVYAICRKYNKASILCMPNFTDFDAFYRQHRIKIWIQIVKRGHAVVFVKDWSPYIEDKWWIRESQKSITKSFRGKKLVDIKFV